MSGGLEAGADDPAGSFEYDEDGCLVRLTPQAFDFFMLADARPGRVAEVLKRLHGLQLRFRDRSEDPYVEGQRDSIRRLLVRSEDRLRRPITQLALMRLSDKIGGAVQGFTDERTQELRIGRWLGF